MRFFTILLIFYIIISNTILSVISQDVQQSDIEILSITSNDSHVFFMGDLFCQYGCELGDTLSFSGGLIFAYTISSISILNIAILDKSTHRSLLQGNECSIPLHHNAINHYKIPWKASIPQNTSVIITGYLYFSQPQT